MLRVFLKFALMLLASSSLIADSRLTYDDWVFEDTEYAQEAFTVNDSGAMLGLLCSKEMTICSYYLVTDLSCEEGKKTPALLNTATGTSSVTLACVKFAERYVHIFEQPATIAEHMARSEIIAIAVPLESNEFIVARFSLKGSKEAIDRARRGMQTPQGVGSEIL